MAENVNNTDHRTITIGPCWSSADVTERIDEIRRKLVEIYDFKITGTGLTPDIKSGLGQWYGMLDYQIISSDRPIQITDGKSLKAYVHNHFNLNIPELLCESMMQIMSERSHVLWVIRNERFIVSPQNKLPDDPDLEHMDLQELFAWGYSNAAEMYFTMNRDERKDEAAKWLMLNQHMADTINMINPGESKLKSTGERLQAAKAKLQANKERRKAQRETRSDD